MRNSKWNRKRRGRRKFNRTTHTPEYIEERRQEFYIALGNAKSESEKEMLIKAWNAFLYPTMNY